MITGKILRDAMISGANNISNQRTRVDELNVFPVPDGDTGTNMSMTIGTARTAQMYAGTRTADLIAAREGQAVWEVTLDLVEF